VKRNGLPSTADAPSAVNGCRYTAIRYSTRRTWHTAKALGAEAMTVGGIHEFYALFVTYMVIMDVDGAKNENNLFGGSILS
jgi:hypothetical protein